MTGQQERVLWERLMTCHDLDLIEGTLEELANQLDAILPTWLNRIELDIMGIDPDTKVNVPATRMSLAARLSIALEPLELTYVLRRGVLEITSSIRIDTDGAGMIRIYDVGPIVNGVPKAIELLTNTIRDCIAPDSWLEQGGCSVVRPHLVKCDGNLLISLIVVAPTETHFETQALLDRLNSLTATKQDGSLGAEVDSQSRLPSQQWPQSLQILNGSISEIHTDDRIVRLEDF